MARPQNFNAQGVVRDIMALLPAAEAPEPVNIKAWPIMESKATHGIIGRIARAATANSEADPVAIIATALVYAAAEFE